MTTVISKENLEKWLDKLARAGKLSAPVKSEEVYLFKPVKEVKEVAFECQNTNMSPKDLFFPSSDDILTASRSNGKLEVTSGKADKESVIFGIRPCDALGLVVTDKPFLADPADELYRQRRQNTALIGLSCSKSCPECFCTSVGTSPNDATFVDVMLTEADGQYIVRATTEKGKNLLKDAVTSEANVTAPAPPAVQQAPAKGIAEVAGRIFDSPFWEKLADRCLHCNICAYVCPSCYCFDIRDYEYLGKIKRVRSWESCQSTGFTKIAGGHEPRATKGAKLRQRFYHKFLYFPTQFKTDMVACTGCGRCVKSCPVNIDIREVISEMQKLGAKIG